MSASSIAIKDGLAPVQQQCRSNSQELGAVAIAMAVVAQLVSQYKAAPARLQAFGVAYASPVAANNDEAGRAKNRRVELVANN